MTWVWAAAAAAAAASSFEAFSPPNTRSNHLPIFGEQTNDWIKGNVHTILLGLPFILQGYGEQALYILDRLADNALKGVSFTWRKPEPPMDDNQVQFGYQWMAERYLL